MTTDPSDPPVADTNPRPDHSPATDNTHRGDAGRQLDAGTRPAADLPEIRDSGAVEDLELAAFADGTLDPGRARHVRARLAGDPQRLAEFGRLRAARLACSRIGSAADAGGVSGSCGGGATSALSSRIARAAVVGLAALLVVGALTVVAWNSPAPDRRGTAVLDDTPVPSLRSADVAGLWPGLGSGPVDLGFLSEQDRLARCTGGVLAPPQVLGARPVVVDGRYGVAVASVAASDPAVVSVVVYGRGCGPFTDAVIAQVRLPR